MSISVMKPMFAPCAAMIMPVRSDRLFEEKRQVVAEVSSLTRWRIVLPDYDAIKPVSDVDRTMASFGEASLVIADLSSERPSCYYELGIAEALKKRVLLIAEEGTPIHQTGYRDSVQFYLGNDGFRDVLLQGLGEGRTMRNLRRDANFGS
jgi:hypothetical protein